MFNRGKNTSILVGNTQRIMIRPIALSLAPNMEYDDVFVALKTLLSPWKWKNENITEKLETEFASRYTDNRYCVGINSGRSALYVILKSLGIGKGDEVIVQAFTCVVVPNAALWNGAQPVYVDIDNSYNIDPKDLKQKITKKTKALIIQNTFGIPADYSKILEIAKKNNIVVIEDCAHALGAEINDKRVGSIADFSFFSFGRDKIISSVFGGMICVNKKSDYEEIKKIVDTLDMPSYSWTLQQLFHPIAFSFILPLYQSGIGKALLVAFQKIHMLSKAVYKKEKSCGQPFVFPQKMSPALSLLALNQLGKCGRFNAKRSTLAHFYDTTLSDVSFVKPEVRGVPSWLRYPLLVQEKQKLFAFAKKHGILLGDWYSDVVVPVQKTSLAGYKKGSCPQAEEFSHKVLNLPTYPTLTNKQAEKVITVLKLWLTTRQK